MPISSAERARYLEDAIDALPEAVAVFDADSRFVVWNAPFVATYGEGVEIKAGVRFEDHLRRCLAAGLVPAAHGREEAWLTERLQRFASGAGVHVHRLGNGRWLRVQDRGLRNGGRVGIRTDVTDLVQREHSVRLLFDINPVPMLVLERRSLNVLAVNDAALEFYGYTREALLRLTLSDLCPDSEPGDLQRLLARLEDGPLAGTRTMQRTAKGEIKVTGFKASLLPYEGRDAILAVVFDVTEQERMEREVRDARAFLKEVVDSVPSAVFVKDMEEGGRYVVYNQAVEAMFDVEAGAAIGRTAADIVDRDYAARVLLQDTAAMTTGTFVTPYDQEFRNRDGTVRLVRTRRVAMRYGAGERPRFLVGVVEDVTEQRRSAARMSHMAHHDQLTDLPNRASFQDRLEAALSRLAAEGTGLALLYLDLDGFKAVNDACGHAVGDVLIGDVAARIRGLIRAGDTAARIGGDEFALLQMPVRHAREAELLAERLVAAIAQPFVVDGRELRVGVSIGIALAPAHGTEARALLAGADAAMYRAKREGRGRFCIAG